MNFILDQIDLSKILPQSYPFLMIDKIIEFKKGESLTAIKNITGSEWVFEGQGYQSNFFPETLIIEAAAQAAAAFYGLSQGDAEIKKVFLGKIKSEIFNIVNVGDQLTLKTLSHKMFNNNGFMNINVSVDVKKIADIEIFYSLQN